ncbi:MAG: hypothetical protein ABIZ04_21525 [Opitutus sp.]
MKPIATTGLVFLAVWLGFELWGATRERTTKRAEISARHGEVVTLRTQLDAAKARSDAANAERAAAAKLASDAAKASAASQAAAAVPAAPRPVDRRIAARDEELSRRNVLHRYVVGFDRLQLPPALLAQAKAIILAREQASRAIDNRIRTTAEVLAVVNRLNQVMEGQLTALLGAEATLQLKSAMRERSIDWTIGSDLWDAGVPLTPVQLQALARVDVQVRPVETHWAWDTTDDAPDLRTGLSRQNADYLAATSRVLSPEQQAALQRSLIEENRYNAAMQAFAQKQKQLSGSQ